jgi:hypothetical protein
MKRITLRYILRLVIIAVVTAVVTVGGMIVFAVVYPVGPGPRTQAWWWHLHHGDHATYDNYLIPVPKNWVVEPPMGDSMILDRLFPLGPVRRQGNGLGASIRIKRQPPIHDVDDWATADIAAWKRLGYESYLMRTLDLNGEKAVCVDAKKSVGSGLREFGWICRAREIGVNLDSWRVLQLKGSDDDLQEMWDIVSGIRRKN